MLIEEDWKDCASTEAQYIALQQTFSTIIQLNNSKQRSNQVQAKTSTGSDAEQKTQRHKYLKPQFNIKGEKLDHKSKKYQHWTNGPSECSKGVTNPQHNQRETTEVSWICELLLTEEGTGQLTKLSPN